MKLTTIGQTTNACLQRSVRGRCSISQRVQWIPFKVLGFDWRGNQSVQNADMVLDNVIEYIRGSGGTAIVSLGFHGYRLNEWKKAV
ncbi:hypothetical protein V6N13_079649 [Hibiscus sabdariffa]